jgi:hypothetical protein
MFSAIRKHLNPTTVVALTALVFAMTGGAFAASSHGGSSPAKATASTTVATAAKKKAKTKAPTRGPAGPAGKNGAAGPAGPTGPAGAAGAKGETGAAGTNGTDGTDGTDGEKGATGATGATGKEGKEGPEGKEGTFGGQTLPAGKMLTGHWAASSYGEAGYSIGGSGFGFALADVSYQLPLAEELPDIDQNATELYMDEEEVENGTLRPGCKGNVEEPVAEPGYLCVFAETEVNVTLTGGRGILHYNKSGFLVYGHTEAKGPIIMYGSWALTAPE